MDGAWRVYAAGERPRGGPEHQIRAILGNVESTAYGYRLPVLELIRTAEESQAVGHLGPDLLGPDWDPEEAVRRLVADPARPLGEALLDQRNLAGIGNVYKSELAFLAAVTPWLPVGELAPEVPARLVATAHRLLDANKDRPDRRTTTTRRPGTPLPRLRPGGPALPPLRDRDPQGGSWPTASRTGARAANGARTEKTETPTAIDDPSDPVVRSGHDDDSPAYDLTGRTAFVTGAASGIGRATAALLALRLRAVAYAVTDPQEGDRGAGYPGELGGHQTTRERLRGGQRLITLREQRQHPGGLGHRVAVSDRAAARSAASPWRRRTTACRT
ncbi:Formamidopyrimidine-DNA glycosylase [Streptomyces tanashiensis]